MDISSRQKISKETLALNASFDQLCFIDLYRTFYPKTAECTFFSSAHGAFSRLDHVLGQNRSLRKFAKIEIISNIFFNYSSMAAEINHKKKNWKKQTRGV